MDGNIVRLSVVDSTNIHTIKMLSQSGIDEGTIVVADMQTFGKGQRGKKWDSEMGKNLLCSLVLKPKFLKPEGQFRISMAVSIAVVHLLKLYGIDSNIKWPNDILVDGKKIAGILIENQISKQTIDASVVGLGLNVNQKTFNQYPWPATSMVNANSDKLIDLDQLIDDYRHQIHVQYDRLKTAAEYVHSDYVSLLYNHGRRIRFTSNGTTYVGIQLGVAQDGRIQIESNGEIKELANGEITLERI